MQYARSYKAPHPRNPANWNPLITDGHILSWLVMVPTDKKQIRARQISVQQIDKLEELWKVDPNATLDDLQKPGIDEESAHEVPHLPPCRYTNANHYQNVFAPLMVLEANYNEKQKKCQPQNIKEVRWDIGLNKKRTAYFNLSCKNGGACGLSRERFMNMLHMNMHVWARAERS